MNNEIEAQSLDRLYETLTTDKTFVEVNVPGYYWRGVIISNWWGYWGKNVPKYKDVLYLNKDEVKHRIYGPAYISQHYNLEEWYKDGKLHRIDGPARTHKGNQWWFCEGLLHRLNGPAVDAKGHPKEYWINGQKLSPKYYKKEIERRKRKGLIK